MIKLIPQINNLYNIDKNDTINFSSFDNELFEIEFEDFKNKYKNISYVLSIKKWIKKNRNHTFPSSKKSWLKTISSNKNLKVSKMEFNYRFYLPKIFNINYKNIELKNFFLQKLKNYVKIFKNNHKVINKENIYLFKKNIKNIFSIKFNIEPIEIYNIILNNKIIILNKNNYLRINSKMIFAKNNDLLSGKKRKSNYLLEDKKIKK